VAVLGAAVAERLFPDDDAVGKTVQLGPALYVVVGVLREQGRPAGSLTAAEVDRAAYVPLRTCRARFGEAMLVRRSGAFTREAVALTEVLVATRQPRHVRDCIAAQLEEAHARGDWSVGTMPGGG
jgi:putative ABC transport system permease protein